MYKTFPLAAVCCFALAATLRADGPPAAPPADPAVARLIEQLGDNDYRVRDEAERALKAAGPRVLPALRQALNHPDAEVRRRANELLPALETAALLAPKRVTFRTTNKPVKDAFDELIRQTGYHIEYGVNDPTRLYSFDFKDVPFWDALDQVADEAGLVLQQGYGDDHVRLYQQDAYAPHVHTEGAFRFVATGFNQYRGVDFSLVAKAGAPPNRSESLTLMFAVYVEPRLALLGVGEPRLDAAFDDEKNSLIIPSNPVEFINNPWVARRTAGKYGNGNRMYSTQAQVNLQRPSDRATALKMIRGALPVTLLVDEKTAVVSDKVLDAKGTKATVGTTQFNFDDVIEKPGKQYEFHLSVTEDLKDDPNDYSWVNSLYQRMEMLGDKGGKLQVVGSQWQNSSANHVEMVLTFGSPGGAPPEVPAQLVYHVWETRQEMIPFEFKDLPLP